MEKNENIVTNANKSGYEKRNVPTLRFKEFDNDWHPYSFYQCVSITNKMVDPTNKKYRDLPHIGAANIEKGTGQLLPYNTAKEDALISGKYLFFESDVIYSKVRPYFAKAALPQFTGLCSADAYPLHPNEEIITPYFLLQSILHSRFTKFTSTISKRTGMPKVNRDDLSFYLFHVPSKKEQEKINTFLKLIDKRIEIQNKIIEDLKVLKKELCNKVFSKGSFVRLGVLIEEVTTRNKSNAYDNVLSVSNKMGFIKQSEQFEDRTVASENKSNYRVVTEGCFAYNPARINVGSIALLTTYKIGIISPMYVCFKTKKALDSEYLNFYYQSGYFYKELQKKLEGSVRQCLTYENMCETHIPYVPIEEQKKIVSALRAITVLIGREDNYLNTLRKQKAYFLNAMFI